MSTEVFPSVRAALVRAGSRLRVSDDEGESEFTVVDPGEADVSAGHVSSDSPLGRAVLGHAAGEQVVVQAPAGRRVVRIEAIVASGPEVR